MLTEEQNFRLTLVGKGTPAGELLRRYWQPVAASAQLGPRAVRPVRVMGESLILFRDAQGRPGLVAQRCAHRLVDLKFGYVTDEGLVCPYHAWTYDRVGQCVAQPAEPEGSNFKNKIKLLSYPVKEVGGLVFAYLGPAPAPELPCWEPLVKPNVVRQISYSTVPCNWLQGMENSPDMIHPEFLHGYFALHALEERGYQPTHPLYRNTQRFTRKMADYAVEPFKYGLLRRQLGEGEDRSVAAWAVGSPVIMPNAHLVSSSLSGGTYTMTWRVPIDDTSFLQWGLRCIDGPADEPAKEEETVPCFELPLMNADGQWNLEAFGVQDHVVLVAQGPITDRTQEHLGKTDECIIMYRRLLAEQVALLEKGGELMNVFRDADNSAYIPLPGSQSRHQEGVAYEAGMATHAYGSGVGPLGELVEEVARKAATKV